MSSHTYSIVPPPRQRGVSRVGAGIALSVLAHGLLLLAFYNRAPSGPPNTAAPREMLFVQLRAPEPKPEPAPEPEAKPVEARPSGTARAAKPVRTRQARPSTAIIAMPEAAPADTPSVSVAPPQEAPAFDPDAARKFAREIAGKPDPAREGMAVAQIPEKPLRTETKTARAIASAKRGDCRQAPGGLLSPLLMLLDKKDSGCKW